MPGGARERQDVDKAIAEYRQALSKLRRMGDSGAVFLADDTSFTFASDLGTASLPWSAVKELWQFETVFGVGYATVE